MLDALLGQATRTGLSREPLSLDTTAVGELDGAESLDVTRPVFSHFVHPSVGTTVRDVSGVGLSTAPGRMPGQFVSHSWGPLAVTKRDVLREVILVAIPPWDDGRMVTFDRAGRRRPLCVADVEPYESSDRAISAVGPAVSPPTSSVADG